MWYNLSNSISSKDFDASHIHFELNDLTLRIWAGYEINEIKVSYCERKLTQILIDST